MEFEMDFFIIFRIYRLDTDVSQLKSLSLW